MPLFPSEQWLDAYGRQLDEDPALDDIAIGWGAGFNGDLLYAIEDLPVDETTLSDLPDFVLEGIPEHVRSGIGDVTLTEAPALLDDTLRPALDETVQDLLRQLETNVVDGNLYAYINLDGGRCTGVDILDSPDERDVGFVIRGSYPTWRDIVNGRPAASAIMQRDLAIEGTFHRRVQYSAMFQTLGDVAADVESVHLFDGASRSPGERLFDEAMTHSTFVHKNTHRHISRSLNLF